MPSTARSLAPAFAPAPAPARSAASASASAAAADLADSALAPPSTLTAAQLLATVPDGQLVERWRAGDQPAGEALFARYFDALFRFFSTKCADPGDLTQMTLLAVVRSRQQFAGRSSFRTYLFSIARNELYDHLRAQRRFGFDPAVSSIVDMVTTPATRLDRGDDHRRLCLALRELPLEQQTLLELHYWEGLDASALAEVFDAPATTIRTRLHRARLALRERLLACPLPGAGSPALEDLDGWAVRQRQP